MERQKPAVWRASHSPVVPSGPSQGTRPPIPSSRQRSATLPSLRGRSGNPPAVPGRVHACFEHQTSSGGATSMASKLVAVVSTRSPAQGKRRAMNQQAQEPGRRGSKPSEVKAMRNSPMVSSEGWLYGDIRDTADVAVLEQDSAGDDKSTVRLLPLAGLVDKQALPSSNQTLQQLQPQIETKAPRLPASKNTETATAIQRCTKPAASERTAQIHIEIQKPAVSKRRKRGIDSQAEKSISGWPPDSWELVPRGGSEMSLTLNAHQRKASLLQRLSASVSAGVSKFFRKGPDMPVPPLRGGNVTHNNEPACGQQETSLTVEAFTSNPTALSSGLHVGHRADDRVLLGMDNKRLAGGAASCISLEQVVTVRSRLDVTEPHTRPSVKERVRQKGELTKRRKLFDDVTLTSPKKDYISAEPMGSGPTEQGQKIETAPVPKGRQKKPQVEREHGDNHKNGGKAVSHQTTAHNLVLEQEVAQRIASPARILPPDAMASPEKIESPEYIASPELKRRESEVNSVQKDRRMKTAVEDNDFKKTIHNHEEVGYPEPNKWREFPERKGQHNSASAPQALGTEPHTVYDENKSPEESGKSTLRTEARLKCFTILFERELSTKSPNQRLVSAAGKDRRSRDNSRAGKSSTAGVNQSSPSDNEEVQDTKAAVLSPRPKKLDRNAGKPTKTSIRIAPELGDAASPESPKKDEGAESLSDIEPKKEELGKKYVREVAEGKLQDGQQDEDATATASNEQNGKKTDGAVLNSTGDKKAMREEQLGSPEIYSNEALTMSMVGHSTGDKAASKDPQSASEGILAQQTEQTKNASPEMEQGEDGFTPTLQSPMDELNGGQADSHKGLQRGGKERTGKEIPTAAWKELSPHKHRQENGDVDVKGTVMSPKAVHRAPWKHGEMESGEAILGRTPFDDESNIKGRKKQHQVETRRSKDVLLDKSHRPRRGKGNPSPKSPVRRRDKSRHRRKRPVAEESEEVSTRCVETQTLLVAPVVEPGGECCRDFKFGIDLKPITHGTLALRQQKFGDSRRASPSNEPLAIKKERIEDVLTTPCKSPETKQPLADESQLKPPREERLEKRKRAARSRKATERTRSKSRKRRKGEDAAVGKEGRKRSSGDKSKTRKSSKTKSKRKEMSKIKPMIEAEWEEPHEGSPEQLPKGAEGVDVKRVEGPDNGGKIADIKRDEEEPVKQFGKKPRKQKRKEARDIDMKRPREGIETPQGYKAAKMDSKITLKGHGEAREEKIGEAKKSRKKRSGGSKRKRGKLKHKKKKYTPLTAPGAEETEPYLFHWSTATIPSVAGVRRTPSWSTMRIGSETGELLFPREGTWTTGATVSTGDEIHALPFSSLAVRGTPKKPPFLAFDGKKIRGEERAKSQSSRSRQSGSRKSRRSDSKRSLGKSRSRSKKSKSQASSTRKRAEERHTRTHGVPVAQGYATAAQSPEFWCLLCTTCAIFVVLVACIIALYNVCNFRGRHSTTTHTTNVDRTSVPEDSTEKTTSSSGRLTSTSGLWTSSGVSPPPTKSSSVPTTLSPAQVYYCASDYCRREAQYIKDLFQRHTDPCDNFYQHVCSIWTGGHPVQPPVTGSLISQDTLLQDALTRRLLATIRSTQQQDVRVATDLYTGCTERTPTAADAKETLKVIFTQWKLGQWPFIDPVLGGSAAIFQLAAELVRDLALPTIISADVSINPENLDATLLELDQPRFLLGEADERSDAVTRLFKDAVQEAASNLGARSTPDSFTDRLMKVCSTFGAIDCPTDCAGSHDDHFAVVSYDQLGAGLRLFLRVLLANLRSQVFSSEKVVLRSASYLRQQLESVLNSMPQLDVLNYMGFLVLVRIAPFLPDELRRLRDLFTVSVLGHTVGDIKDRSLLCARLVERALPDCFIKASQQWRQANDQDVPAREWLSQLESVFLRHSKDFAWMSELSSLLVRYLLKRRPVVQFGHVAGKQRLCAPLGKLSVSNPLLLFAKISQMAQDERFRRLFANSSMLRKETTGSDFAAEATFRNALQSVHVPAALFNVSVPIKGSVFVFHLARVAVRFYRALVRFLHENSYERDSPISFTVESRRQLEDLITCFENDARANLPDSVGMSHKNSTPYLGRGFLDRTSALQLALSAFEELLYVRRIWKVDLRLQDLSQTTARQLFFIYFALDNCESADRDFHASLLPAEHRVNLPLRHMRQFTEAFGCRDQDHMMVTGGRLCDVLRRGLQR